MYNAYDSDTSSDSDTQSDWESPLILNPCSQYDIDELVNACRCCGRFCVKCCFHETRACHHCRLVFTDGSCLNNGAHGSASGIGIAFGRPEGEPETGRNYQFSISVDDRLDPGGKRTNQRAELLAALHGLKKICRFDDGYLMRKMEEVGVNYLDPGSAEIVVATDSEYVVKGVTEWLPKWRANGLKKSDGQRPSNIDLFLDLGAAIEAYRYRYGCKIKFWHIKRRYNTVADELAKRAAMRAAAGGDPVSMTFEASSEGERWCIHTVILLVNRFSSVSFYRCMSPFVCCRRAIFYACDVKVSRRGGVLPW